MKHLIFTRFYSRPFALTNEQLLSDKYLIPGLQHLQRYLIPSLANQTNLNFTLVILINNDLKAKRPDIYEQLIQIKCPFEVAVVEQQNTIKYADSLNETRLIGSRIDIDDCIFNEAVDIVQSKIDPELDFCFYAFMNGATMLEDEMYDLHQMVSVKYDGWSSISIFPTLIVNWKKHRLLPIYNHTKLMEFAKDAGITLVHDKNHFYDYHIPCAWLYVQHDSNATITMGRHGHRSDVKLNYSKEQIHELFGI